MNYFETLEKLRREVFSEPSPKPKEKPTGFIPVRQLVQTEDSRDVADRPREWLKQIKQASEEIKKSAPSGGFASGFIKTASQVFDKDKTVTEKPQLSDRRGDTPSKYSPDKQLTPAGKTTDLKGKEAFIEAIYPMAIEVGKKTGVDPRIIVAQAALETGWGKSAPNNNYFGIKSHGKAGGATMSTKEVINGKEVTVDASFRQFDSPADSVVGYGEFLLENPRYKSMLEATTLEEQVRALGRSGYATDPNYADKIYSIATGLPPLSDEGGISFLQPKRNPLIKRRGK